MTTSASFYLSWAKERVEEMDAVVSSLERQVGQLAAQSRNAAEHLLADLRRRRDAFLESLQKQGQGGEGAWADAKARMEVDWSSFQSDVKKYVDDFGQHLMLQRTTFQDIAAAQLKAWREAADRLQAASAELAADHRASIEPSITRMRADASDVELNLRKLAAAGSESWTALATALSESRTAFDKANKAAWDALQRAM
jgi:hypothetical protein